MAAKLFEAQRYLRFNPLLEQPNRQAKPLAMMQQPPSLPVNPKVGLAKFSGKKKANAGTHVGQFETRWQASGYGIHPDDVKNEHFLATLQGKAVNWFTQYGLAHFQD